MSEGLLGAIHRLIAGKSEFDKNTDEVVGFEGFPKEINIPVDDVETVTLEYKGERYLVHQGDELQLVAVREQ